MGESKVAAKYGGIAESQAAREFFDRRIKPKGSANDSLVTDRPRAWKNANVPRGTLAAAGVCWPR
jgi:hypothetical protein